MDVGRERGTYSLTGRAVLRVDRCSLISSYMHASILGCLLGATCSADADADVDAGADAGAVSSVRLAWARPRDAVHYEAEKCLRETFFTATVCMYCIQNRMRFETVYVQYVRNRIDRTVSLSYLSVILYYPVPSYHCPPVSVSVLTLSDRRLRYMVRSTAGRAARASYR